MAETPSLKRAKGAAAGQSGKKEVPLSRGRRLDAATPSKATEIERSGSMSKLEKAARRLKETRKPQKVPQVPQNGHGQSRSGNAQRRHHGYSEEHDGNQATVDSIRN